MFPIPMPPLRYLAAGAAALGLVLAAWWALDSYGDGREDEGRAAVQALWDADRAAHEAAATKAAAEYRQLEYQLADIKQEAAHAREVERTESDRAFAAVRADRDRLRESFEAYASGRGLAAPDSLAACRERATDIAGALDEALSAHAECTSTAAHVAADLRAVLAAWPVINPAPERTEP